jgi:hypothetical protein
MDDVEEVPVDKLHGRLFGQVQAPVTATPAPLPNPVPSPPTTSTKTSIGKPPPEPEVKTPNAQEVGRQAAMAGNAAKADQKPAETPSAIAALGNELIKNWWIAPLAVAGHHIISKALGESEKPKATPIESRKIGAGPQMNVNTGEPRMVGDLFPADVSTKPTGPTPENPTIPLTTEIGKPPKESEMVKKAAENPEKNAVLKGRQESVNPFAGATELRTGTGKPAFEGANPEGKIRSSYPDIKSVPKGYAFIPDARYIDVLRNDLGQAEYTKNLTGRPFPKEYLGPAGAVEVGKEINRSLGRETRAELLAKGIPESQLPKPTPGILEKTNAKGNKAVTVGGIVGAIAALPNLVHAAQGAGEKDVQKSYGSLVQGVGQFLGPLGAIGSELFGISPEELDTLRKAEKSRKQPVPPPR